jgi:hypothetical protein
VASLDGREQNVVFSWTVVILLMKVSYRTPRPAYLQVKEK